MRQVPYPKVAGLPPEAQRQLRSNFEAVVKALQEGTTVDVPFPKIAGLPPEAQRQILRNFQDLECNCPGTGAVDTINTSDTFTASVANVGGNNTDVGLGGAASLWTATPADNWPTNVTAGLLATPVTGTSTAVHTLTVDTTVTDHAAQLVVAASLANNRVVGLIGRYLDINNYYSFEFLRISAGVQELRLSKVVAGVTTLYLGGVGYSHIAVVGDVMRFDVVGSALTGSLNGAPILTFTDPDLATGTKAGVYALGDNACKVDNFITYI